MRNLIVLCLALTAFSAGASTPSSASSSGPYTCNGTTTAFVAGFQFLENAHLLVQKTGLGVTTALVLGTDYTVTGAGATSGTVNLVAGSRCPTGYTLTIRRVVPLTQPTTLPTAGPYSARVHEKMADRAVQIGQQLQRQRDEDLVTQDARDDAQELLLSVGAVGGSSTLVTATGTTTARTLAERSADRFNVKDYGAKGDGATDDTAAVQAALTAAAASGRQGGTVIFPRGEYRITSTITVAPAGQMTFLRVTGDSMDSTALSWYGGAGTALLFAGRTRGLRLENLRIEQKGVAGTGVGVQFAGDVAGTNHSGNVLEQVRVQGFSEGIALGDASGHAASETELRNVVFTLCTTGLVLRDTQTTNVWLRGASFSSCGTGLKVINGSSVHVLGGSASASTVQDFEFTLGAADWTVRDFRSENAYRFLSMGNPAAGGQTTSTYTIDNCQVTGTTAVDKRSVQLFVGAQYLITNSRFAGHVYLATGTGAVAARTTLTMIGNLTDATFIENGDAATAFTLVYALGNKKDATTFFTDRIFYWRDNATTGDYWARSTTGMTGDVQLGAVSSINGAGLTLQGRTVSGTTAVGVTVSTATNYAHAGAKLLLVANNGVERANVDKDGGLQIGVGNTSAPPTCDAAQRGKFWYRGGEAGVADAVQVCAKDLADAFAWRTIY